MAQHGRDDDADPAADRAVLLASPAALVAFLAGALPRLEAVPPPELGPAAPPPRAAAVLVPIYARRGSPHLLFTRRAPTLSSHRGEISFPGGGRDPGDDSPPATALREAREELALPPERVRVLGALPPVFTVVSNYLITPVVGWLDDALPPLAPSPAEVTEVIEAPLAALADPAIFHEELWERRGRPHAVYFYDLGPYRIWGATARILHQLLALLAPAPVPPP